MKVGEARSVLGAALRADFVQRLEVLGLQPSQGRRPVAVGTIRGESVLRLEFGVWRDSGGTCHVLPQAEVTVPEVLGAARMLAPGAPDLDFTFVCTMTSAKPFGAKHWAFGEGADPRLFLEAVLDNVEKFLLPAVEGLASTVDLAAAQLPLPVSARVSDGLMVAAARFVLGDEPGAVEAIELAYPAISEANAPFRAALQRLATSD